MVWPSIHIIALWVCLEILWNKEVARDFIFFHSDCHKFLYQHSINTTRIVHVSKFPCNGRIRGKNAERHPRRVLFVPVFSNPNPN